MSQKTVPPSPIDPTATPPELTVTAMIRAFTVAERDTVMDDAGVHKNTWYNWRAGHQVPTTPGLLAIARVLRTKYGRPFTVEELLAPYKP